MPALKLGVRLASFRQPLREALISAARLGVGAIELDARSDVRLQDMSQTGVRQLRKLLEDHGLRVAAVRFRTRRGYDLADELDRRVEATRQALRFAHQVGAPLVVNRVGHIPEQPQGPAWDLMRGVLAELVEYSARAGALLAAETGGEDGPALARLLDALPEGALAVDFDPGSILVNGFSPLEVLAAVGPAIRHVHATDGVRDLARGRGLDVPLGRGSVDYAALLGALEERDYRGYFTVGRPGADDPVTEATAAIEYLNSF
ncbi:MAG: sugar phosphate isomerase/epimerase [Pirellulales bacterium]|nr:sugar phosphate isomerase/epimerase [Pirellulales bacterium]